MKNGTPNPANVIRNLSPFSKNWKKATRYIAELKARGLPVEYDTFGELRDAARDAGIIPSALVGRINHPKQER